ncbi:Serine/threonine-protein kinase Nek1 [Labeo rohita]|uniref:non-specific serine/threonine protein kinase n=1 Tax=Labeo rohita TaxID=84645 RepID=A0ABQ8L517_LABRO|nr:probable serine/threonine-protein kinase DDB_G0284251 [Labeo rohita]KAI2645510.1 Serine/threonine-protein kinase Nek1 [Labeo rohita]
MTPNFDCRRVKKHGYTIKEVVGRGASGIVFLVNNEEKDQFVVKQLNSRDRKELATVKKEIEILKKMIHGYIVSYVDSFEDKQSGLFYIVMEYCAGGDLFKKMQTQKDNGFFEEQQILDWFVQICLALQYIHENNVLHRDIRPQNVFLTEDGYINLGDFGCSKILERGDAPTTDSAYASLYLSPEVYQKKYNSKSDIWSLGWLLHDLCMLDVWSNSIKRCCEHAYSMKGTLPRISKRYSKNLQELIRQMLSCDPKDRPSADEILAKPFLEDAVKRNKRIPEALEQRLIESVSTFDEAYNKHYTEFENLVSQWGKTADLLEAVHYSITSASLAGSVITAIVGAILSTSIFASLTGVGVSVAGGATGAATNIADSVKQKQLYERLEQFKPYIENGRELTLCLLTVRKLIGKIFKFHNFACTSTLDNLSLSWEISKSTVVSIGRAAAVSGVLGGLSVIADAAFIAKDSQEIHQMRNQWKTDDPIKVSSSVLKAIVEIRNIHKDLLSVLEEINKTRKLLDEKKNKKREREKSVQG